MFVRKTVFVLKIVVYDIPRAYTTGVWLCQEEGRDFEFGF